MKRPGDRRSARIALVAAALALTIAPGPAHAQFGGPLALPKTAPRVRPDVGPIDSAMRALGDAATPASPASAGDIVATMPFAYGRTGILMSDVKGRGLIDLGFHETTTGAPGFFVGRYGTSTQFGSAVWELWCFLPNRVGGKAESLGLLMIGGPARDAQPPVIVPNKDPFWPDRPAQFPKGIGGANAVVLDERPVDLGQALTLKYRFLRWTGSGAEVEFLVGDHPAGTYETKFEADGSVHLGLLGGSYVRLTRAGPDQSQATADYHATGAAFDAR